MINNDLPKCLSCRLTGKSEEDKIIQAEEFISKKLSKSKYTPDDYEMQIVGLTAYFTRKGE